MTLKRISKTEVQQVVTLHSSCLPETTSSKLGPEYLNQLYLQLLSSPLHHELLGISDNNSIVGVITITNDLDFTISQISPSILGSQMKLLVLSILRGRISLFSLAQRFLFEKMMLSKLPRPHSFIMTLFVHPSYRRKGIARKLMNAAITWSKEQKRDVLIVDTEITNTAAQHFYRELGFRTMKEMLGSTVLTKAM